MPVSDASPLRRESSWHVVAYSPHNSLHAHIKYDDKDKFSLAHHVIQVSTNSNRLLGAGGRAGQLGGGQPSRPGLLHSSGSKLDVGASGCRGNPPPTTAMAYWSHPGPARYTGYAMACSCACEFRGIIPSDAPTLQKGLSRRTGLMQTLRAAVGEEVAPPYPQRARPLR